MHFGPTLPHFLRFVRTRPPPSHESRAQCGPADFPRTFGNISVIADPSSMFVEQEVIVPEVRPGHVPVEILDLRYPGAQKEKRVDMVTF